MAAPKELLRIVDANCNRAKEGLRVCEDICRFIWDDKALAKALKDLRHDLTAVIGKTGLMTALACRDIEGDVGRSTSASERKRAGIQDVFYANSQRIKESLRVLEEILKLIDPKASGHVKKIRYSVYAIEKKSLKQR